MAAMVAPGHRDTLFRGASWLGGIAEWFLVQATLVTASERLASRQIGVLSLRGVHPLHI
jgi:hypothetical protein